MAGRRIVAYPYATRDGVELGPERFQAPVRRRVYVLPARPGPDTAGLVIQELLLRELLGRPPGF